MALENARLQASQRDTIARLEGANEDLRHVLSAHEILTAGVIGGNGIQSVADSLARLIGGEVLVLGPLENALARSSEDGELRWTPPGGEFEARTISERTPDGYIAAAPAAVDDEIFAWLVARLDLAPGQVQRAALEYGALLVAIELLRERTALEVEHRLRGGFLEELFSGEFVEDLLDQTGDGIRIRPPQTGARIPRRAGRSRAQPGQNARSLHRGRRMCRGLARRVIWSPSRATPRSCWSRRERDRTARSRTSRSRISSSARFAGECRSLETNIAVSRLIRSLPAYGRAYAAARRGLDLVRLLGRSGQIVSFRNMGVQEILLAADEPATLLEFIMQYVEPLERYDAEHSSDLLHSLETFYDAGFNLQEAARRLDVHVSTLRYRLTRIEELLGVDPKIGDSRLNIEVAVKAARALAVHRN